MSSRTAALGVVTALGVVLSSSVAHAQGAIGAGVRSTLPPPVEAPKSQPAPTEFVRPERPNIEDTGPRIEIRRFEVSGNEAISTEALQQQLAPYANQRLSLLGIYDVADSLTDFYRAQGFSVASVSVPAQKVTDGVVQLTVLEGRVGKVDVQGNQRYSYEFIRERTTDIKPGSYLQGDSLQNTMLLLNDLPGLSAQAVVQPGAAFGETDVVVKVDENPYDVIIGLDNHGREAIGRGRVKGDLFIYNPTGVGDQLHLTALGSEGSLLRYGAAKYTMPLGTKGTRLEFAVDRNLYELDDKLTAGQLFTGDGNFYEMGVRHPIIRSLDENLQAGLWFNRTESDDNNGVTVSRGFVNLLEVGVDYDRAHEDRSVTSAQMRFSTNFNRYGNHVNDLGVSQNQQAGKLELTASHIRSVTDHWSVLGRVSGVLSLDPLMALEKFRIGGPQSVRGFPSSELSGDQGVEATIQLQRGFSIDKGVPGLFKVFWDGGVVHRMDETRDLLGVSASESLNSVGTGINVSYGPGFSIDVEAAWPLGAHQVSDGLDNGRLWASFNAVF